MKKSTLTLLTIILATTLQAQPPKPRHRDTATLRHTRNAKRFEFQRHFELKIDIDFNNASLHDVLNYLAQFSNKNVVISPAVHGNLSIHLKQVAWQKAFNVILQSQQLGKRINDNIIYIAPLDDITKQEQLEREANDLSPLKTTIIRLNYAKAADTANLLKSKEQNLLSKDGSVSTDNRTNTIIIRDHENQLNDIQPFIKQLDIPVKQVLIEARIVSMDQDYEKDLGIRFGITGGNHMSGTLDGAHDLAKNKNAADVDPLKRLNINLPAINENAAHLGVALMKIAKNTMLDLELSALETEGHATIISSPKLMTANQQTAIIESGEEIPYQEKAGQNQTSIAFKKAVLSLKVTPQITPDNKIMLHLNVTQDKRSSKEVKGVPTITARHIETQVLVKNNETVVLGGIFEQTKIKNTERVPFISDIPYIGKLFQRNHDIDNRRELLIFVTPRIFS